MQGFVLRGTLTPSLVMTRRTGRAPSKKAEAPGGKEYHLPIGWKRFAVQVKGVYDDGAALRPNSE